MLTIGILPAMHYPLDIELFLEENPDFASEFGTFARNTLYLARLYLSQGERKCLQNVALNAL